MSKPLKKADTESLDRSDILAINALLRPAFSGAFPELGGLKDNRKLVRCLRHLNIYRNVVAELYNREHQEQTRPKAMRLRKLNCPPVLYSGWTGRPMRSCSHRSWCPYCFHRQVTSPLYLRLKTYFFHDQKIGWLPESKAISRLLVGRLQQPFSFRDTSVEDFTKLLKAFQKQLSKTAELIRSGVYVRVIYPETPNSDTWLLSAGILGLVPLHTKSTSFTKHWRAAWQPDPVHGQDLSKYPANVTKKALADAIFRVAAYPFNLLTDTQLKTELLLRQLTTADQVHSWGDMLSQNQAKWAMSDSRFVAPAYLETAEPDDELYKQDQVTQVPSYGSLDEDYSYGEDAVPVG